MGPITADKPCTDRPLREVSQAELRSIVSATDGPVVATVSRRGLFMSALTWPALRALAARRAGLPVLKVMLRDDEAPDRALRARWIPATILFVGGRSHARYYGGELDVVTVLAAIERSEPSPGGSAS